jgi:hypothetical protein
MTHATDPDATPAHATSALLTSEQAGEYLHVNPRTLANWRVLGRGPRYVRSGARALYRLGALDAWLDAHTFEHMAAERAARTGRPFRRSSATA